VTGWPQSTAFVQNAILPPAGASQYYPAMSTDSADNMILVFARSSSTEFASIYYTGRMVNDPLNTVRDSNSLKMGGATVVAATPSAIRWGDYFGASRDPMNGSLWIFGEYAKTSSSWGTWIGRVALGSTFTDDPLVAQSTIAKGVHITELRVRIDALRAACGLPAFSWTDGSLIPGQTLIYATHIVELRNALNEAYDSAGRARPAYTDATIVPGVTTIKAIHLMELREAIIGLE
jgi:hypothetical protein